MLDLVLGFKNRLQNGCFSVNIPKVLATVLFIEKLRWLLLNYAFQLISLFYVQIQEPTSMSTTRTAFAFLAKCAESYYHQILETRSRWRPKLLRG